MTYLTPPEIDELQAKIASFLGKTAQTQEIHGGETVTFYDFSVPELISYVKTYPNGTEYLLYLIENDMVATQNQEQTHELNLPTLSEVQKSEIKAVYGFILGAIDTENDVLLSNGQVLAGKASTGEERVKMLEALKAEIV